MNKAIILLVLFLAIPVVFAADYVPDRMSFEGFLTDNVGNRLTGNYRMNFTIFSQPSGGVSLFNESDVLIPVSGGIYHHDIGSIVPLQLSGNETYYLELAIGGEKLDRINMTQSMWSQRAQQANNLTEANSYVVANLTASTLFGTLNASYVDHEYWINETGDHVTGNINMSDNNITATRYIVPVSSGIGFEYPSPGDWCPFKFAAGIGLDNTGLCFSVSNSQYEFRIFGSPVATISATGTVTGTKLASSSAADAVLVDFISNTLQRSIKYTGSTDTFSIDAPMTLISGANNKLAIGDSETYLDRDTFNLWINSPRIDLNATNVVANGNFSAANITTPGDLSVSGNVSISENLTVGGEFGGSKETLQFTRSTLSASGYSGMAAVASTGATGYIMMHPGSITGLSFSSNATVNTTAGNITIQARINDSIVLSIPLNITTLNQYSDYRTQPRNTDTFNAGDYISTYISFDNFVGSINPHFILVEVQYDS